MLCTKLRREQRTPQKVVRCDAMKVLVAAEEIVQVARLEEGEDAHQLVVLRERGIDARGD